MKYQFNFKLFAVSVAVIAIAAVGAYFWHQWQLNVLADAFLDRATQLERDEDWSQAAAYVYRYLQVHPDDADAKVRLARVYDKSANRPALRARAIELFYQASSQAPAAEEGPVKARLAQLLVESGRYDEGLKVADEALKKSPEDADALLWKGLALYRKLAAGQVNSSPQALKVTWEALQAAHQSNPESPLLAASIATALRTTPELLGELKITKEDRESQADQYLDQLVASRPNDVEALLARYQYRRTFDLPNAQQDLDAARAISPKNDQILMLTGQDSYARALDTGDQADRDHAIDVLTKLSELAPGYAPSYLHRGNLLALGDKVDDAVKIWRLGISKAPNDSLELRISLARSLAMRGDISEANQALQDLEQQLQGFKVSLTSDTRQRLQASISLWRGTLAFRQGDYHLAEKELKPATLRKTADVLEIDSVVHAWLLLGEVYSQWQHWDRAALAYEAALQHKPQLTDAQVAAAKSWRLARRPDRAAEHLQRLINNQPTPEKFLMLAENELDVQSQRRDSERNWQAFRQAASEARRLGGRDWDDVWQLLLIEARSELLLSLGENEAKAQEHAATGLALLGEVESQYADRPGCLRQLAMVYEAAGRSDEADRLRGRLASSESLGVDSVLTQAEIALRRGDVSTAKEAIQAVLPRAGLAEKPALQAALDRLEFFSTDPAKAYAALESAFQKEPRNLLLLQRLAESCIASRSWTDLQEKWEPQFVLLQGENSPDWLFYRSVRLISEAKDSKDPRLQEAQTLVDRLKSLRPQWASSYVAQAQLQLRQGAISGAIANFQQSLDVGETRLSVYQTLLQLLRAERRFQEADALLSSLRQKSSMSNPVLDSLELSLAAELGQVGRGVALARKAVEARPQEPSAHQWLGEMLLLSNQIQEAERSFQQAAALKPQDPANWIALFQFYVRTKQRDLATKTLVSLEQQSKLSDGQMVFALAQGYEALQDIEQAGKYYKEAERQNSTNAAVLLRIARFYQGRDPEAAIELLRRVTKLSPQAAEPLRLLVILLAARGEDSDWSEIDTLWKAEPSAADLRLRAVLSLRRSGSDFRNDLTHARQLLAQVVQAEGQPSDETRRLIVQLALRQAALATTVDDRQVLLNECREHLRSMAAKEDATSGALGQYIDFLLRYDSAEKAREWVAKLVAQVEPSKIGPHARLISFLIQRQFTSEALQQLSGFEASLANLQGDDAIVGAKALVALCVQAKVADKAKPHLEKLLAKAPHDLEVVALGVTVYYASGDSASAIQLIQGFQQFSEPKLTEKSQQVQLAIQLGQLYSAAELHDEALKCYQRAYDANPQAITSLIGAFIQANRTEDAVRLCDTALAKSKSAAPVLVLVQGLLNKPDGWREAAQAEGLFQSALQSFPSDLSLRISIAILRTLQDRPTEAIQLYRQVLAKDSRNLVALNNLAVVLAETDATGSEAIELVSRAIVLGGANNTILDSKGLVCLLRNERENATFLLSAAAAPPNSDPRHHLHYAAALAGDEKAHAAALTQLNAATKLEIQKFPLSTTERKMLDSLRKQLAPQQTRLLPVPQPGDLMFVPLSSVVHQ